MRRIWHILGLVIARIYNDLDNQIIGDLHCSRAQVNVINPRSRWDLFFLIYTFMVLVELDVGNIMPYVIREAPSTTSFCHDDSMLILLFLTSPDINPRRVITRVGSREAVRCISEQDLTEAIEFCRPRHGSQSDHGFVYCR